MIHKRIENVMLSGFYATEQLDDWATRHGYEVVEASSPEHQQNRTLLEGQHLMVLRKEHLVISALVVDVQSAHGACAVVVYDSREGQPVHITSNGWATAEDDEAFMRDADSPLD